MPPINTVNSCSISANSKINVDSLALGESIPLIGVPFSLEYSSDRFRPLSGFAPLSLGLGGWTPSIVHHYDKFNSILYTGDGGLRNVQSLPLPSGSGIYVSDPSGSQVFTFNSLGQHLQTINSLTGSVVYSISYDVSGRISSITDAFGNFSSFQYGSGTVRLVSPYSQVTNITLDTNGYLSSVTNPNNETFITQHQKGLLVSFQKPGGQVNLLSYDANGFLLKDQGAGGDFVALSRSFDASSGTQTVLSSTALNRITSYQTTSTDPNVSSRQVASPDGSLSQSIAQTFGTNT